MGSMDEKRSHNASDWREGRRLRAWELSQAGWSQAAIAGALGVTAGAVSQWLRRAREGGVAALYTRKAAGPKPQLSSEQRARLPELLVRGAEAYGFRGDIRTRGRVAEVIWCEFGVRLSAISGITPEGMLYLQVQEQAFRSDDVVRFLEHLLRHIPGKLLVIWDGSPIHRGQVIKDFLASGAAQRIHLERLPGYAPDLNPDEGIWNYLKRGALKNVCCRDLAQIRTKLRKATQRLRHKKHR
jgi:transposase